MKISKRRFAWLMIILAVEKGEGETTVDFEKRMKKEADSILNEG